MNLQALTEALDLIDRLDVESPVAVIADASATIRAAARSYANLFTPDGNLNPDAVEAAAKAIRDLNPDVPYSPGSWTVEATAAIRAFLDHEETRLSGSRSPSPSSCRISAPMLFASDLNPRR